jgi:hypothetical protein
MTECEFFMYLKELFEHFSGGYYPVNWFSDAVKLADAKGNCKIITASEYAQIAAQVMDVAMGKAPDPKQRKLG